jgi:N-acyl-D-aspartate/D-glutamate deacylase
VTDIVIRNGLVVDGSGAGPCVADVGIDGGRIVEIGEITATGNKEIDATDRVVAPCFVDVHTHYDAQVRWDPLLQPSSLHGVTTMIGGNCGFTIAPLPPEAGERAYLREMLSRVEAIPLEALEAGPTWDWSTFGEYLEGLDGQVGVNVGFLVGHSTIRRGVLGPDAVRRTCTDDELRQMQRLLTESLEAGGLGFSSTRNVAHGDADGSPVPSRHATFEETVGLASVARRFEGTTLEMGPRTGGQTEFSAADIDEMAAMSRAAERMLNWNLLGPALANREMTERLLDASAVAAEQGAEICGLSSVYSDGARLCIANGFVFDVFPGWGELMHQPLADKISALRDPDLRVRLDEQAHSPDNSLRRMATWESHKVYGVFASENQQYVGRTFGEIAAEQGRSAAEVMWDIVLADDLRTSFGPVPRGLSEDDWKYRVECWQHDNVIVGGSDAGAHVDMLSSFNYPTKLLAEIVRRRGLLTIEAAIRLLTDVPARRYGLRQRGRLEPGWHADVVVFDLSTIESDKPDLRTDLPAGAARLFANAAGVEHVMVNGVPVIANGQSVEGRGGTVLRAGRDTTTPSI